MTLQITTAHQAARNAASVALADSGPGYSTLRLPSTSPAYTRKLDEKLVAWRAIGDWLHE